MTDIRTKPRVLILGGGFGGVGAARKLADSDVEVVLVDAHDYHTFQPMLYQVATDLLAEDEVAHPLRDLFHKQPNVTVHVATATSVDVEGKSVEFDEMEPIAFDYLVMAMGAEVNFFGVEGASEHAFPMYTLSDAVRLRKHVLDRWEAADRNPDLVADGELNIVVVGGGPTGVESVGALSELYRSDFSKDYPNLPLDQAKLSLVEAGPSLFSMFEADLQEYASDKLSGWGVELLMGEVVQSVSPTRVQLKSGRELKAHTLVWGAGLQANPLAASIGVELERGGRLPVGPDLTVEGRPDVYAVGDIAWIAEASGDEVLPQLGSVALQSGESAGENIARRISGDEPKPFGYHDKGTMATIGPGAAVIQFPHGRTMKGKTASLAWGAVHLALLSTGEDRTKAMLSWAWAGFTHERGSRIVVESDSS